MTGILHFETFLLTGILLNITPGNDTIFILSCSIAQGKKAGIVSALGVATGSIIHTLLAAFGLSILISQSIILFDIIKYAGAAYIGYIGFKMLLDKSELNTAIAIKKGLTTILEFIGMASLPMCSILRWLYFSSLSYRNLSILL